MHVYLITVGDELLLGQTVNSNATWMAQQLSFIHLVPREVTVVGDVAEDIHALLDRRWAENNLLIVTGGLGPTADDVTKTAVADYLDRSLSFDETVYDQITERLESRGIAISEVNRGLAMVKEEFESLPNT